MGICPGSPCDERKAAESAFAGIRFSIEVLQWPAENILLIGRSIGTGPAIMLATEYALKGLLLVSPFLSVKQLCREAFGPISHLIQERFANNELIAKIRAPCLVVHGQQDTKVPFSHGIGLFEKCC